MAEFHMKTYIYVLKDPINQHIRYVGKTISPKNRYKSHKCLKVKKGTYLSCWIESLRNKDLSPIMEIIDEVEKENSKKKEIYYISFYKNQGCNLVNLTDGGDGCDGYKHSKEIKLKMSEIQKKHWKLGIKKFIPSMKGKKHTEESKIKMSVLQIGKKNHNYGRSTSEETKLKISKILGKKIIINGIYYQSLRKAAEGLNLDWSTFKYRYNKGMYL